MCNQCQALMINGVYCHEIGCPIAWKDYSKECDSCGCDFKPEEKHQTYCEGCAEESMYYDEEDEFHICFANEGSALRCSSKSNPRNLPCPTCKAENRLTPADQALGYQCDQCADSDERGGY